MLVLILYWCGWLLHLGHSVVTLKLACGQFSLSHVTRTQGRNKGFEMNSFYCSYFLSRSCKDKISLSASDNNILF